MNPGLSKQLEQAKNDILTGEYDRALESLNQIIAEEPENSPLYIESLVCLGQLHWHRGKYESAQSALELAKNLGVKHDFKSLGGEAVRYLGNVLIDQGFPKEAESHYRQALEFFREVGNREGIARTMNNLGVSFTERGDYEQGLEFYTQALTMHRELNDLVGEGAVLNNLGEVHRFRGDYEEAERLYQISLEKDKELGDPYGQALCWGNLGAVALAKKDFEEAERRVRTAVEIFEELRTFDLVYVEITGLMSGILANTKRFEESQEFVEKMWDVQMNLGSDYATSICAFYSGLLAQKRGNLHTARSEFTNCLEISQRGAVFEYQLLSMIQLVELELQTYRLTQEDEYLEMMETRLDQTLEIARKHNSIGAQVQLLTLKGFLDVENQQFLKGLENFAIARELAVEKGFESRVEQIDKHIDKIQQRIETSIHAGSESIDKKLKRMQGYIEECQRVVLASK